jgi:predicted deacylase
MANSSLKKTYLHFTHDWVSCDVPVYTISWNKPGKNIVISAGIHGDEINGIKLATTILAHYAQPAIADNINGTMTIVPVLNPLWFKMMQRRVPVDGCDLNRSFGNNGPQRTRSNFFADFLYDSLCAWADHMIDLHDAWSRVALLPHPRIHACESNACSYCTREMSWRFGSHVVLEREWEPGMMAVYANDRRWLPIMTLEVWGNQELFEEFHPKVLKGIEQILVWLWYLQWAKPDIDELWNVVSQRTFYAHPNSWIVTLTCSLWQQIKQWDLLALHVDPMTNITNHITATQDGIVFSVWCASQYIPEKHILSTVAIS